MLAEVTVGAVIALLAGGLGYAAARYQTWVENKVYRRTLATSLLAELQYLDATLRRVAEHGPASWFDPFEHPTLESALGDLRLFKPATAKVIVDFHFLLRHVRASMNAYREDEFAPHLDEVGLFIKAKARWALVTVRPLKEALLLEGASEPLPIPFREADPTALPEVPARNFPEPSEHT